MLRLFLDANVLFTAAHTPDGKAAFLFAAVPTAAWEILTSDYAIEEAMRNLARKYPDCVPRLEELVAQARRVPQPDVSPSPAGLPEKDLPIYFAARGARATHLLTGDLQHFGALMNNPALTEGVIVQTVADFLRAL